MNVSGAPGGKGGKGGKEGLAGTDVGAGRTPVHSEEDGGGLL